VIVPFRPFCGFKNSAVPVLPATLHGPFQAPLRAAVPPDSFKTFPHTPKHDLNLGLPGGQALLEKIAGGNRRGRILKIDVSVADPSPCSIFTGAG